MSASGRRVCARFSTRTSCLGVSRDKIATRHQTNVHVLTHLPSKSRRPKWHLANFMARSYPNQLAAPQKGPSLANVMSTLGTQDCRANEPELRLLGNDQSWDRSFNGHLNPRTVEAQKDQSFWLASCYQVQAIMNNEKNISPKTAPRNLPANAPHISPGDKMERILEASSQHSGPHRTGVNVVIQLLGNHEQRFRLRVDLVAKREWLAILIAGWKTFAQHLESDSLISWRTVLIDKESTTKRACAFKKRLNQTEAAWQTWVKLYSWTSMSTMPFSCACAQIKWDSGMGFLPPSDSVIKISASLITFHRIPSRAERASEVMRSTNAPTLKPKISQGPTAMSRSVVLVMYSSKVQSSFQSWPWSLAFPRSLQLPAAWDAGGYELQTIQTLNLTFKKQPKLRA